jgi:hypothetical protein
VIASSLVGPKEERKTSSINPPAFVRSGLLQEGRRREAVVALSSLMGPNGGKKKTSRIAFVRSFVLAFSGCTINIRGHRRSSANKRCFKSVLWFAAIVRNVHVGVVADGRSLFLLR